MRSKLNEAIANGLGQSKYVGADADEAQFVSFVIADRDTDGDGNIDEDNNQQLNSPMSVPGTLVIRSVVPGAAGKLNFSGDEDLIKAL